MIMQRRLDVLLDTLLRIENDHLFRYLQMTSYNNPTDEDVRLQDRHNRGLEIDDAKVKQITNFLPDGLEVVDPNH
jgi:UDP-N-acetylmuramoylalanine-D-glutamate ligase